MSPTEAVALQKKLREELRHISLPRKPKFIAGADVSLERFGTELFAGIIVLSYPSLEIVEHSCIKTPVTFPYVPGLLSFREIPGLLECWDALKTKPDVVVVDGHGIAHPRRLGIAAHFGLVADVPTIGCAKSRLYGEYDMPSEEPGSETEIIDPKTGEVIGIALRSKKKSNPLLISPGNLITLAESLSIIKTCLRGYRLPEPTRLAHNLVNAFRKNEISVHKLYQANSITYSPSSNA
ncbi:MAG: deoxyribonuclease [Patescibacteria group bacterium]|nr:deoxyribonuclease [Patescibacteria group bacterium]